MTEVLVMKTGILNRVKELSTASQPDIFTLCTDPDVKFSASADAAVVCKQYGTVCAPRSPDPSKCVAKGKLVAVAGETATIFLS